MSKIFDQAYQEINDDIKRFVEHSFNIADRIHYILKSKNIRKKNLASILNKKESEVYKLISGTYDFSIREISKIESFLKDRII